MSGTDRRGPALLGVNLVLSYQEMLEKADLVVIAVPKKQDNRYKRTGVPSRYLATR